MNDSVNQIKAYSDALFMLSEEDGITDVILADAKILASLVLENPEYIKMLDSPALSKSERLTLVNNAFGTLSRPLVNVVSLLVEKRSAHVLPKLISEFEKAYEQSRGIERVTVISAFPLNDTQILRLREKLEGISKKQIIIENTHDPSMLGGMKLRYMGKELDGTVKSKLDSLEKQLSELVI